MPEVPEEAIDAALAADAEWMRTARKTVFVSPSRDQVQVMLEAAAPLIAADERAKLSEIARSMRRLAALEAIPGLGLRPREVRAIAADVLAIIGDEGEIPGVQ